MVDRALRLLRLFHDMNQTQLAEKLGISKSYLCEIESGKKTASIGLLDRYSEVFGIPTSSLLLFSERLDNNSPADHVRLEVARKITILLEWISETEHSSNAEKCDAS